MRFVLGLCRNLFVAPKQVWILFLVGLALSAHAGQRQALRGHMPAAARAIPSTGNLDPSTRLDLTIGLPLRNQGQLTNLLCNLYDPANPLYRKFIEPGQFAEQFGPAEADYQALMAFARSNGMTIRATHSNRTLLDVQASVADIQRVFQVTLRRHPHPREARAFFAPDTEPSIDAPMTVLSVDGLENYNRPRPLAHPRPAVQALDVLPNIGTGPGGSYRGYDFRSAYAPGVTLTGAGQSVGLFQLDGYYASDISNYVSQCGLPWVALSNVLVGVTGVPGYSGIANAVAEVSLDIEMAIAMAPGLSKVYVYEGSSPNTVLNRMATDNLARQLSCSWAWSNSTGRSTMDQIFQQFAAQGQSFFCASGDSDAYSGTIWMPCDDPYITIVGGTTLGTSSAGGAWSSETVWNYGLVSGSYVGSSGGVSPNYTIPTWQQGMDMTANLGSTTYRNLPDLALTADNIYVLYNNGSVGIFAGTSCAAPLWAGYMALINQQAAGIGQSYIGFLNTSLYSLCKSNLNQVFHDITAGNNYTSNSPAKYAAVTGYDLCTGWGTPKGQTFINALVPPKPILALNGWALIAEDCVPANGVVDPDETVAINVTLQNTGFQDTTNLVVTLQSGGGVVSPGAAQTYGALIAGGPVITRTFTFTASGVCGGKITATLQMQDGSSNWGTTNFSLTLGTFASSSLFSDAFDAVAAPALPSGWAVTNTGAQTAWVTSTTAKDTPPNAAFVAGASAVGESVLVSPVFNVITTNAQLSFRHFYNLEISPSTGSARDAAILEISIAGGAFTDFVTAGGRFLSNGYNRTVSSSTSNPLKGRSAWGGNSGGFITTTGLLPPSAAGNTVRLKWHYAADKQNASAGWYVDSISAQDGASVCCGQSADVRTSQVLSPTPSVVGQNVTCLVTVTNAGPAVAAGVIMTNVLPAGALFVSASPGCTNVNGVVTCNIGLMAVNSARSFAITFTPVTDGPFTNEVFIASIVSDPDASNNASIQTSEVLLKPEISTQPANRIVVVGSDATFDVVATGSAPLCYQWFFNQTNLLAGEIANSLTLSNAQSAQQGGYSVVVSNAVGSVTSAVATLTVLLPPSISADPTNAVVVSGSDATFTVVATGSAPLGYQWFFNQTNLLAGETADSLTVTNSQSAQQGGYLVIVSNAVGSITSTVATLTVLLPPSISADPTNIVVVSGSDATFNVVATGSAPLGYQWFFNETNLLVGEIADNLTVTNAQSAQQGGYSVIVSNAAGSVTSAVATLTVLLPPSISADPTNIVVVSGSDATFTVVATGSAPLGYQWFFNQTNLLAGEIADSLTLTNAQSAQQGGYSVIVSNAAGSVTSAVATLTVLLPPSISADPTNIVVVTGSDATFNVVATGSTPLGCQWFFNETNLLAGEIADSLTLTNAQSAQQGGYSVIVSNAAGIATSRTALLRVLVPATISVESVPTASFGPSVSFVSVAGLTYTLEYKESLESTHWIPLSPVSGTGERLSLSDTNTAPFEFRFYRVRCE